MPVCTAAWVRGLGMGMCKPEQTHQYGRKLWAIEGSESASSSFSVGAVVCEGRRLLPLLLWCGCGVEELEAEDFAAELLDFP